MATETKPLCGKALLAAAVNHIIQHPETWDQSTYGKIGFCGTVGCIAHHMQRLGGRKCSPTRAKNDARELGELSDDDARWLFAPGRTLSQLHAFTAALLAGAAYFDREGKRLPMLEVPE